MGFEHVERVGRRVEVRRVGRGGEAHEELAVRQRRGPAIDAALRVARRRDGGDGRAVLGHELAGAVDERERVQEELRLGRHRPVGVEHARVDRVVVLVGRVVVDAERAIEDAEHAALVLPARLAEDRREVLVGELDHLARLVEADRPALRVERVVVAAVEVLAAQGELIEARLALHRAEDDAAVVHEARPALHVQLERELARAHLAGVVRVGLPDPDVRVGLARVEGLTLRARVVEVLRVRRAGVDASRRHEEERLDAVGIGRSVLRIEIVNGQTVAGAGDRVDARVLRAPRAVGVHLVDRERLGRARARRERDLLAVPRRRRPANVGRRAREPAPARHVVVGAGDDVAGRVERRPQHVERRARRVHVEVVDLIGAARVRPLDVHDRAERRHRAWPALAFSRERVGPLALVPLAYHAIRGDRIERGVVVVVVRRVAERARRFVARTEILEQRPAAVRDSAAGRVELFAVRNSSARGGSR